MFKTTTDTKQAISLIYNSTSNFDWKKLLLEQLETGTVYLQNRKLKAFPFLNSGDPCNQRAFPDIWYLTAHALKGQTRAKNVSNVTNAGISLTGYHPVTPPPRATIFFLSKSPPQGQIFRAKLRPPGRKNEAKSPPPGILCLVRMFRYQWKIT